MPTIAVRASAGAAPRRAARSVKATRVARDVRMNGEYGASGTSFYTTTEKQESYDSLDAVLDAKCADPEVKVVIKEQLDACADITEALRSALVTVEGSANTFGDAQLSVDVIADNIMWAGPGRTRPPLTLTHTCLLRYFFTRSILSVVYFSHLFYSFSFFMTDPPDLYSGGVYA